MIAIQIAHTTIKVKVKTNPITQPGGQRTVYCLHAVLYAQTYDEGQYAIRRSFNHVSPSGGSNRQQQAIRTAFWQPEC